MRTMYSRAIFLLCFLVSSLGCCCQGNVTQVVAKAQAVPANSSMDSLAKRFGKATALLYAQTEDGNYVMLCTATAYERVGKVYHFVAASHCVAEDDEGHEKVDVLPNAWYLQFDDDPANRMFIGAKLLRAGYKHRGDDFAVFEATPPRPVPVVPLAKNDPSLGEEIINFAAPGGYGKQLFHGWVSMEKIERPIVAQDINWKGAIMLQTPVAPGSSGSAIVSTRQGGIIAILVGLIGGNGTPHAIAIQVSKFKKFNADVAADKYKWYKPNDDGSGGSSGHKATLERIWKRIHGENADMAPYTTHGKFSE